MTSLKKEFFVCEAILGQPDLGSVIHIFAQDRIVYLVATLSVNAAYALLSRHEGDIPPQLAAKATKRKDIRPSKVTFLEALDSGKVRFHLGAGKVVTTSTAGHAADEFLKICRRFIPDPRTVICRRGETRWRNQSMVLGYCFTSFFGVMLVWLLSDDDLGSGTLLMAAAFILGVVMLLIGLLKNLRPEVRY